MDLFYLLKVDTFTETLVAGLSDIVCLSSSSSRYSEIREETPDLEASILPC